MTHALALALPMIDVTPQAPPGVGEMVNTVLGYAMWAGGIVAVLALIVAGITIMLHSMGRVGSGAEQVVSTVGYIFIGAIVLTSASAIGYALTGV